MTTRLFLLRHGIAVPSGTPGVEEDQRPLTDEGAGRVHEIAGGLKRLGVEPEKIVTSPLPRALRTAEIVAKVLGLKDRLEHSDALRPAATAGSIRDWLQSRGDESLMLVGHNPSLNSLLGLLLGFPGGVAPFELKKGGSAELRSEGGHSFTLEWLATPRLIRKLHD